MSEQKPKKSNKLRYLAAAGVVVGVGGLLWWMFSPGTASAADIPASGTSGGASSKPAPGSPQDAKKARVTKTAPTIKDIRVTMSPLESSRLSMDILRSRVQGGI